MNRLIKHIRRWNKWRKNCMNTKWHKLLVLLGLRKSPTMATIFLPEETNYFVAGIEEVLKHPINDLKIPKEID